MNFTDKLIILQFDGLEMGLSLDTFLSIIFEAFKIFTQDSNYDDFNERLNLIQQFVNKYNAQNNYDFIDIKSLDEDLLSMFIFGLSIRTDYLTSRYLG